MNLDDPRHGSYAGAQQHWRDNETPCSACHTATRRYRKSVELERLAGRPVVHARDDFERLLEPWLALGLSRSAICVASDLRTSGSAAWVYRPVKAVRRSTWDAVSAITEESFPARWTVWSDLTKTRIQALMANGHPLSSLPIDPRGRWRDRDRISIGYARAIRDYYLEHQDEDGPSAYTRTRSLARGYQPPIAWDDPGTVAWPLGWTVPLLPADVDDVVVERVLAGERLPCTPAERAEVLRRADAAGRSLNSIEKQMGWNAGRVRKEMAA